MRSLLQHLPSKYLPSYVTETRSGIYETVGLLFALLFFGYLVWEWLSIGVLAIPEKIADYHFGSEAMIGEGGPHYVSAEAYAQSALRSAVFPAFPLVILLGMAAIRNNAFYRLLAWVSLLAVIASSF